MNIKVCGITQLKQLKQLDALGIEFAGFIFYEKSPRCAVDKIMPAEVADADFDIKKVGVFVNATYNEIMKTVKMYGLDSVQLHGEEEPQLCKKIANEIEVIKTFHIQDKGIGIEKFRDSYDDVCDYYLFDAKLTNGVLGSSGMQFNWDDLLKFDMEKPFFLSGGISIDDVNKINSLQHPDLFAVDINSKFEIEYGIKDVSKVLQFKKRLKG